MMDKKLIEILESRLSTKKEEYRKRFDYFKFTVDENENKTQNCFEKNASNALIYMIELSAEIRELEHILLLMKGVMNNKKK